MVPVGTEMDRLRSTHQSRDARRRAPRFRQFRSAGWRELTSLSFNAFGLLYHFRYGEPVDTAIFRAIPGRDGILRSSSHFAPDRGLTVISTESVLNSMVRSTQTILFDLDGTICEYRRSGSDVLAAAFDAVGVEPFFDITEFHDVIGTADLSGRTFLEFREDCFARIAEEVGREPSLGREIARAYAAERDQSNVRFLPGVPDALDRFGERYPLGLITNGGPEMQMQKLNSLGITDNFEAIVYAGYDTPAKPDPAPFRHALQTIGAPANKAVYIGNSLQADVLGAQRAGLTSVWLADGTDPEPAPDYLLHSTEELLELPWARAEQIR